MTSQAIAVALRELSTLIEQHPDLPWPFLEGYVFNVFLMHKEELAHVARAFGGTLEKYPCGPFFALRKHVGPFIVDFNVPRTEVCHRVVTGTRVVPAVPEETVEVVEWICDESLLDAGKGGMKA